LLLHFRHCNQPPTPHSPFFLFFSHTYHHTRALPTNTLFLDPLSPSQYCPETVVASYPVHSAVFLFYLFAVMCFNEKNKEYVLIFLSFDHLHCCICCTWACLFLDIRIHSIMIQYLRGDDKQIFHADHQDQLSGACRMRLERGGESPCTRKKP